MATDKQKENGWNAGERTSKGPRGRQGGAKRKTARGIEKSKQRF